MAPALFVWDQLDLRSRWIHVALPILFLGVEFVTFGDRKLTTEKMWAGIYGAGLTTLTPLVLMRKGPIFRILSCMVILNAVICFGVNIKGTYWDFVDPHGFFKLRGMLGFRMTRKKEDS